MTTADFKEKVFNYEGATEWAFAGNKPALIDFYADWCGPCKRMKPYLDEFKQELSNKLVVIRINADDNQDLCKALNIDALPVLKLYKNKELAWTNKGFISKEDVLKKMRL